MRIASRSGSMGDVREDSEVHIVALLDAGDARGAATEIVRVLGPQILGYLSATLRDDDAAQDAFA